jgi:hypothetical protein
LRVGAGSRRYTVKVVVGRHILRSGTVFSGCAAEMHGVEM